MRGFILRRDYSLMQRANNWDAPRWVQLFVVAASRGGDGWLWYAMGLVILAFGGSERFAALGAAGIAAVLSIVVFIWMKRFTGRKRPCQIQPHRWATLLPPDQFSFPSGHTITAFAVAVSLGGFYPELIPGLVFCAVSIAASRVVLGMHFLSDVLAGAALGASLGAIATAMIR